MRYKMKPKFIQISAVSDAETELSGGYTAVFALAEDGTVWHYVLGTDTGWDQLLHDLKRRPACEQVVDQPR